MSNRDYRKEAKQLQELFAGRYDEATLIDVLIESRSLEDAYERILANPSIVEWNNKGNKSTQQSTQNTQPTSTQSFNQQKPQYQSQNRRSSPEHRGRGGRSNRDNRHSNNSDSNYKNNYQRQKGPIQSKPISEKIPSAWSKLTFDKTEEAKGNVQKTEVKETIQVQYEEDTKIVQNQPTTTEEPQKVEHENIFYQHREEPEPQVQNIESNEVVEEEITKEEPPLQPQQPQHEEKEQQFTFMPSKSSAPQFQPQQTYQSQPQQPQYQQIYEQSNIQPQNPIENEAPAAPVFVSNQNTRNNCLLTLPKSLQPFSNTSEYQQPYFQPMNEMQMRQAQNQPQPPYQYLQQYPLNTAYFQQQFPQQPGRPTSQPPMMGQTQQNYQQFPTGIAAPPGF